MPRARAPRVYPAGPLFEAAGATTQTKLASLLGVSGTQVKQITAEGLTDVQADRYAVRLGLHPLEVWGLAWVRDFLWAGETP